MVTGLAGLKRRSLAVRAVRVTPCASGIFLQLARWN